MDLQSPLSQLARPERLQPKIVELYEQLLHDDTLENPEGFWREFFLLRPDRNGFEAIFGKLAAHEILVHQASTQQLFTRAVQVAKEAVAPADENAIDTLTAYLECVLSKRYHSPSTDIISVIAGLDDIDHVFSEFVTVIDVQLRGGRSLGIRQKVCRTAIAAVAGAYQTSLISYFMNRDIFPAVIKLIQDCDSRLRVLEPLLLLGLLSNYNKFEFQNPYRTRLEDFVHASAIEKAADLTCLTLQVLRDAYIAVQDDVSEAWNVGNALSYLGLGGLTGAKTVTAASSEEEIKAAFADLPPKESAVLLCLYDFVQANKLFAASLASNSTPGEKSESNFSSIISLASYVCQNAHRSVRATQYAYLLLLTVRNMIEDATIARTLASAESQSTFRLCRQRQPLLPVVKDVRVPFTAVLDLAIDGVSHNLRRRLDAELYSLLLDIILRSLSYLSHSRTRLAYHWAEVWRALLSFVRFLISYAPSLSKVLGMVGVVDEVCNILAFVLTEGESFLPDAKSYNDLLYKIFESWEALQKLSQAFELSKRPSAGAVEIFSQVAKHYEKVVQEQANKGNRHLSPREVDKVIKQSSDKLDFNVREPFDKWIIYREVDFRNLLKRATRIAVQDVKALSAVRAES